MARAQLSNELFNLGPSPVRKPIAFQAEAFPFLKNNEYFNPVNPGETYFGFRGSAAAVFQIGPGNRARLTTGLMVQEQYGGKTLVKPVLNLTLVSANRWQYHFGALQSGTRHGLLEPMYNYEHVLFQPLEYGIQARKSSSRLFFDGWVEWRRQMNAGTGEQEMIIGGLSAEPLLLQAGRWRLSSPLQGTIVHRGGQALLPPKPISNRINTAGGLSLKTADTGLVLEGFYLQSLDGSPNPTQPFSNGWAAMANARVRMGRYHTVAATWWYGREFQTVLGSPVFSNVNEKDVYANAHTRRLLMLRYVYSRPILGENLFLDVRLEPHYDLERGRAEFSHGLYLKFVTSGGFSPPRLPGLF